MENCDVGTCNIPAAFMQAEINEEVHIKRKQELVDLLISMDETSYSCCVTYKKGKKVMCSAEQCPVQQSADITLVLDDCQLFLWINMGLSIILMTTALSTRLYHVVH
jgi:hypothetical protein